MAIPLSELQNVIQQAVRHVCNAQGELLRKDQISVRVSALDFQVGCTFGDGIIMAETIDFSPVRRSSELTQADGTVSLSTDRSDNTNTGTDSGTEQQTTTHGRQTIGRTTQR
jgi:spore coat protein U-like protein